MPRITLDEVNKAIKQNGPILTDAEVEENRIRKITEQKEEVSPVVVAANTPLKSDVVDVFSDTHELTEKFFGGLKYERDYDRLVFEISRIKEELNETIDAVNKGDASEVVDGVIDLITFALGFLENFGVDGRKAWRTVHEANMAKEKGTKKTRPNSKGVDLIKPKGWKAPDHSDNVGLIGKALDFS